MAKEGRNVAPNHAAAHIVASGGKKNHWAYAADSRALMNKYGLNVDTAANGVSLGHPNPHGLTHTKRFNMRVNERLHSVENTLRESGRGKKGIRKGLQRELRSIGRQVEAGDFNI